MADDLGAAQTEVHADAAAVLRFWFDEVPPEQRFAKDAALDRTIAERFGKLRARVAADAALGWRDRPDHLLAAIVLLDQFSRNLFRDTAAAFATDDLALELARHGIAMGWDEGMPAEHRAFLYMPLMHAEDADVQAESVALFTALGDPENLKFAREHADVITQFGRFPSRNAALSRESTPAEREYLSRPDAGW